ncbi:MAG: alkaline phosphatase family protein [Phycisphaerae bacterium]|nr:alkaline phosphatase family protein [Phycisphaerae bacterium]
MKRLCTIDIAGLSRRLVSQQTGLWVDSLTPGAGGAMRPTFPAVAPSVQASMTTGREPGRHGVVSGGVFRRQSKNLSLLERSNTLLRKKRFWRWRDLPQSPSVALVFWSNPLAGGGDIVLGASTYACQCGKVSHQPLGLYDRIAETCGQFDCDTVSGLTASWKGSQWIASAAGEIWRTDKPDLMWVYLPGVDFELVRGGVVDNTASAGEALADVDQYASRLAEAVRADGGEVVVVSNGGYSDVSHAACPNRILRDAGLLAVRETPDGIDVDIESSQALALVDHQFAHLYCVDEAAADRAADALADMEGLDAILPRSEVFCSGLGHDRAGERVAVARPEAWFAPRWMRSDEQRTGEKAPAPLGYDPCELICSDSAPKVGAEESSVRASRGRSDVSLEDSCFLAATCPLPTPQEMCVTDLPDVLKKVMFE